MARQRCRDRSAVAEGGCVDMAGASPACAGGLILCAQSTAEYRDTRAEWTPSGT